MSLIVRSWRAHLDALRIAAERSRIPEAARIVDVIEAAAKDDLCTVAVLGEWSRGKSTLVNLLLQRDLVPVDVRPTTAGIVQITHGDPERALVLGASGSTTEVPVAAQALRHAQTAETGGLESARRVELVLRCLDLIGFRLVDTPGVNDLGDTADEIVFALLPFVDLAVFVLDATNGGLSRSEQDFLKADLLGPFRPPVAFLVNKMDGVAGEDDDERDEVEAAFREQLREVGGPGAPVLFGAALGRDRQHLRDELLRVMREAADESIVRRRERLVRQACVDLDELIRDQESALGQDEQELERRVSALEAGGARLGDALARFRSHVRSVGEAPLKALIRKSLETHATRTGEELERRIGMTTDLAAYARHGLVHEVTAASRAWGQAHAPEVTTFLRRHLQFLTAEFEQNFGATFGRGGGPRVRIPEPEPLASIDADAVASRQRDGELARYVLPGLFSVVGGMIALPLGVAGLYVGMKLAADAQEVNRQAVRSDLRAAAGELVRRDAERMRQALEQVVEAYFADLDDQLARACQSLTGDAHQRYSRALEDRRTNDVQRAAVLEDLTAAKAGVGSVLRELRPIARPG